MNRKLLPTLFQCSDVFPAEMEYWIEDVPLMEFSFIYETNAFPPFPCVFTVLCYYKFSEQVLNLRIKTLKQKQEISYVSIKLLQSEETGR